MKSGVGDLIGLGRWGKGMIDELKDITANLEDAESDIAKYDSDGVISFHHIDQDGKYQSLFEDFKVLHKFTGKVGDIVDRTIDQPFYEDIDGFMAAIRDASISNYTTENRIGATEIQVIHYGHGIHETQEIDKTEVNLDDLLSGGNFYSDQMKLEYEAWKEVNPDQEFSQEDYQLAAVNMRAFGYESIKDQQQNKEFWVNVAALVVIVGVSLVCPPAGLSLGIAYGTFELSSAVSGKDWISGRELGTAERWTRGLLAPLDIVPGVAGIKKFSGTVRTANQFANMGQFGTKTGLKTAIQHEMNHVGNMVITAGKQSSTRLKSAGNAIKDGARVAKNKAIDDIIEVAELGDKALTGAKNIMPTRKVVALEQGMNVKIPAENTHFFANKTREILGKADGVNVGGSGAGKAGTGKFGFDSTSELQGFKHLIDNELKKNGINIEQFNNLRLKSVSELTDSELKILKKIRDSVPPVTKDTLLQKTIPIADVDKYLSGEFTEIGGYVAKVEDVTNATKYEDVVESLRLDYTSWDGTRPYPKDGDSYAMIRFKTSKIDEIDIPYGEKFGGSNTDGPPCTQNGFTGSRNGEIVPEWEFIDRFKPLEGAELFQVINGNETLVAVFDGKKFIPIE